MRHKYHHSKISNHQLVKVQNANVMLIRYAIILVRYLIPNQLFLLAGVGIMSNCVVFAFLFPGELIESQKSLQTTVNGSQLLHAAYQNNL